MKLSPQQSQEPDVNLTPMIDVVFLLLLFFMVTTSFVRESALKIDLPQATGEQAKQNDPINIVISANGEMLVNETPIAKVTDEVMQSALKAAAGDHENPQIVISADAKSAYQLIITAMDSAQQLGYHRITLATRQNETP